MRGFFAKQHRGKLSCRLARLLLLAIMADVSDESYPTEPHKTKHKRDRNERRARDRANRYGDGMDGTSSPAKERNNPGLDDSGVANDLASTGDRVESARRDRRERRKPKEEVETHANDEAPVEGATAAMEETSPKKSLKKDRKSENSAHKRQAKRHLREKRRSTGVVIMPGGADGDVSNYFIMFSSYVCLPVRFFFEVPSPKRTAKKMNFVDLFARVIAVRFRRHEQCTFLYKLNCSHELYPRLCSFNYLPFFTSSSIL